MEITTPLADIKVMLRRISPHIVCEICDLSEILSLERRDKVGG